MEVGDGSKVGRLARKAFWMSFSEAMVVLDFESTGKLGQGSSYVDVVRVLQVRSDDLEGPLRLT